MTKAEGLREALEGADARWVVGDDPADMWASYLAAAICDTLAGLSADAAMAVIEEVAGVGQEWRDIPGWPYEVSSLGRVRSTYTGAIKSQQPTGRTREYRAVFLTNEDKRKLFRVHWLVASAFVPNPNGSPYIHHKNNKKDDNRASNLEWVTPAQNSAYAAADGLIPGHRGAATLTEAEVATIRATYEYGVILCQAELARIYNMTGSGIFAVLSYKSWPEVLPSTPLPVPAHVARGQHRWAGSRAHLGAYWMGARSKETVPPYKTRSGGFADAWIAGRETNAADALTTLLEVAGR